MFSIIRYVCLTSVVASLIIRAAALKDPMNIASIGDFQILWDDMNPYIEVFTLSKDNTKKTLFKSLENWPFLTVGYAASFRQGGPIVDGNYKPDEWTLFETPYQSIILSEEIVSKSGEVEKLVFTGELWGMVTIAKYQMTLSIPRGNSNQLIDSQLDIDIKVSLFSLYINIPL